MSRSHATITREKLTRASQWAMTRDVCLYDASKQGHHVVIVARPNKNNAHLLRKLGLECELIGRYRAEPGMLQDDIFHWMVLDCIAAGLLPECDTREMSKATPLGERTQRLSDRLRLKEAYQHPKYDGCQSAPRSGARGVLLPDAGEFADRDWCLA